MMKSPVKILFKVILNFGFSAKLIFIILGRMVKKLCF